jgi:uncharacterized protein (DUF58 family)
MLVKRSQIRNKEILLTREGWIYLAILGFITVGAILRNVNLLILMAGMMIAPLVINWRLAVYWLRMVSAKRVFPNQLHARQSTSFQWVLRNRSRLTAWGIEVADSLYKIDQTGGSSPVWTGPADRSKVRERSGVVGSLRSLGEFVRRCFFPDSSGELNVSVECPLIGGNQEEVVSCRVYFPQRGLYQFGPARIGSSFPFGIIRSSKELDSRQQVFVAPMLGVLTPVWDRRIRSVLTGVDSYSRRRGAEEEEFHALRRWQSGDNIKQIHWRTSARLGHLTVKQFEQPDNRDFAILLDLYCPAEGEAEMLEGYRQRCETVLSFATTTLLQLDATIRGRIAVAICGSSTSVLRSRVHREIVAQSMPELAVVQPQAEPELAESLLTLSDSVSASTPIFVISSRSAAPEFALLAGRSESSADRTPDSRGDEGGESKKRGRLEAIWPAVCWLNVTSSQFRELFTLEKPVDRSLQQLTQKWKSTHAAR